MSDETVVVDMPHEHDLADLFRAVERARPEPPAELLKMIGVADPLDDYEVEWWAHACGVHFMCGGAMGRLTGWRVEMPVYARPRNGSTYGGAGVLAADFVAGLLRLHRFGVDLGAMRAVDAYRPLLLRRKRMTDSEVWIWWAREPYWRMRGMDKIVARQSVEWRRFADLPQFIATTTGYDLYLDEEEGGNLALVSVPQKTGRTRRESMLLDAGLKNAWIKVKELAA